jgi:hypothetical protein
MLLRCKFGECPVVIILRRKHLIRFGPQELTFVAQREGECLTQRRP